MADRFIWFGFHVAWCVWGLLAILLLFALVQKRKGLMRSCLKTITHSLSFLVAYGIIFELALIVNAPVHFGDREHRYALLREWLYPYLLRHLIVACCAVLVLAGVNAIFAKWIERGPSMIGNRLLLYCSAFILFSSAALAWLHAYSSLGYEIESRLPGNG
jgi:hypothetical protein